VETCWTRTRSAASSKAPKPRRMSARALPTQTERHVAFISVPPLLRCVPSTTVDERRVRSLPSHVLPASRSQPGGSSEHQQCHVVTARKCVELTIGIGGMRGQHARGYGGMPEAGKEVDRSGSRSKSPPTSPGGVALSGNEFSVRALARVEYEVGVTRVGSMLDTRRSVTFDRVGLRLRESRSRASARSTRCAASCG
jgi:hypothetical protein